MPAAACVPGVALSAEASDVGAPVERRFYSDFDFRFSLSFLFS
jgi:hypothetical protein